jgi:hypothetical protein
MPATPPEIRYDVFISYSHADKTWVKGELLPRLEKAGLKVCLDDRDFRIGAPIVREMERAVLTSRHTIAVLTPAYLSSAWADFEALMIATLDPGSQQERLLPLLLEPCDLPLRIKYLGYADFAAPDDVALSWVRLLDALAAAVDPGIKPDPTRPAETTGLATPPPPAFNTAVVRELLMAAFSDEDLTTFCYDNFRPVYEEFATGMSRTQKVQRLVETCDRHGEMAKLLARVERANPYQYDRFRNRLRN